MHMRGRPETMQENPWYDDPVEEVYAWLAARVRAAREAGVERLLVDPGIGFGKRAQDNLALLRRLRRFRDLGCPVLVGTSRKAFIGAVTGLPVGERLPGTIASCVVAVLHGAQLLRVHDVAAVRNAVRLAEAIGHDEAGGHDDAVGQDREA
jgi:dihydropteroate synthase